VLEGHRARNRPNKPPNPDLLLAAAQRQLDHPDGEGGPVSENEGSEDEDESSRAPRHSKSHGIAKPTSVKYYPGAWSAAIIDAKNAFRRYTILHNLFPVRDSHLPDAAMILSKVIAALENEGIVFDSSESCL
jgi:hypothetical protein